MREETDQYRDSSSNPISEIYDSPIVDSLDLQVSFVLRVQSDQADNQSLSLNYPPIKPKRREDTPTYSSSSSSNDQDSFPRQVNVKMFPTWFFDCSQRDRSPDTRVSDDNSTRTGRSRDEILPSYNDLYQLDVPGQSSTSAARQYSTDSPATGHPLVGGLDFSRWENNDPEGDACFAAVSSASRGSEDMEGGRSDRGQEAELSEERSSDRFVESDQLIDLDHPIAPNRFPPTHRPDYPDYSSYPPLTPSRLPSKPKSPYQGKLDQNPDESMGSYMADFESSLDSNNGIGSKRKYDDDEDDYVTNEGAFAGPSTQSGFKRGRFRFLSSSEDEGDEQPIRGYLIKHGLTVPTSMEVGEEWQGDSLTADTSNNGETQSTSSRDDRIDQDIIDADQQPIDDVIFRVDVGSGSPQEENIQYDTNSEDHQRYSDDASQLLQQHSEGSDPDSAIEVVQWPSDTPTVVDPSADWLGHVPVHTSQQLSDDAMEQSGSDVQTQSPVHPADIQESQSQSLPESQMAIEPPSTLPPPPVDSPEPAPHHPTTQPESRKRPAEEVSYIARFQVGTQLIIRFMIQHQAQSERRSENQLPKSS